MEKLSLKTKTFYGLGLASRGIKDGLFQLFLVLYFSQILGLDARLAGLSSLIALSFDAISDPVVGIISDKWKSKNWGRRHPFMLASALPFGIFIYVLFAPPASLSQMGLFWWLTGFGILVRLSMTFFVVPYISLGAELSKDYKERTTITASRLMFAAILSPVVMIIGYVYFLTPSEAYPNGALNRANYPNFILLCSILIVLFIVISTLMTRDTIPNLPQPSAQQNRLKTSQLLSSVKAAFKMPSFRSLVFFTMFLYVGIGIGVILSPYFSIYFFEFTTIEMAILPISSAIGGVLAMAIAPNLGDKLDKKTAAIWGTVLAGIFFTSPFSLSLMGVFPEPNSESLLLIYVITLIIAYASLWVTFSLSASMMADVVDEFELQSGNRQEGLFFSSMSFSHKMTTGVGTLIAGFLLSWIQFPKQTNLADVPPAAIEGLGYIGGPFLFIFYMGAIVFLFFYPITKERYQEIRAGLDEGN